MKLTPKQRVIARGMNALSDLIDEGNFGPEDAERELGRAYDAGLRHGRQGTEEQPAPPPVVQAIN